MGDFKMSDSPLPVGIKFEYRNAFASLIEDFYHSNHDLLLVGIRLLMSSIDLSICFNWVYC